MDDPMGSNGHGYPPDPTLFSAQYGNPRDPFPTNHSTPYGIDPELVGAAGPGAEMNALAAAATDQLYEMERGEAMRRAEFEMRHRQMISGAASGMNRGSQGGSGGPSPSTTPGAYGNFNQNDRGLSLPQQIAAAYQAGLSASTGGAPPGNFVGSNAFYPISAAQPSTNLHPAVGPGTLADPSYLLPPTCHHDECQKSYRKRLKMAKQTRACPNCLTLTNPLNAFGLPSGGPGGGSGSNNSSQSNTPQSRSLAGSHEDLHGLGGGNAGGAGGNPASNLGGMVYQQQVIQQHLQRLAANQAQQKQNQQKLLAQLKNQASANTFAHSNGGSSSAPSSFKRPSGSYMPYPNQSVQPHNNSNSSNNNSSRQSVGPRAHGFHSNPVSAAASPASDSSEDDFDDPARPVGQGFDFTPMTSPVLGSMKNMSLFPPNGGHHPHQNFELPPSHTSGHSHRHGPRAAHLHLGGFTAPTSLSGTPSHSRGPSRAGSPEHHHEGHVAGSGKHGGHTSHMARDAKYKSHPYGHSHHSTPNPPNLVGSHGHPRASVSARASPPPRLARTHSSSHVSAQGGHSSWNQGHQGSKHSVEEILNTPAVASDRILPPPTSSFASHFNSISQSAPTSSHNSPSQSRAASPGINAADSGSNNLPAGVQTLPGSSSDMRNLSRGVRAAFGMTPIHDRSPTTAEAHPFSPPRRPRYVAGWTSPDEQEKSQNRLPPLGHSQGQGALPSLSRAGSRATTPAGNEGGAMEVDARS
jgi:zinc finger protein CreA/MIG